MQEREAVASTVTGGHDAFLSPHVGRVAAMADTGAACTTTSATDTYRGVCEQRQSACGGDHRERDERRSSAHVRPGSVTMNGGRLGTRPSRRTVGAAGSRLLAVYRRSRRRALRLPAWRAEQVPWTESHGVPVSITNRPV